MNGIMKPGCHDTNACLICSVTESASQDWQNCTAFLGGVFCVQIFLALLTRDHIDIGIKQVNVEPSPKVLFAIINP